MMSRSSPRSVRFSAGLLTAVALLGLCLVQTATAAPPTRQRKTTETLAYKIHAVRSGDTLEKIAARKDLYNDRLKWFLVYFQNREELGSLHLPPDEAPTTPLRPGTILALLPPNQVAGAARKATCCGQAYWVVNIRSRLDPNRLNRLLLGLLDLGDFAYLTTYQQRGKTWYRLRVGFFHSQGEAAVRAGQLGAQLNLSDLWIAKAADPEVREYIGYVLGMKPGPP